MLETLHSEIHTGRTLHLPIQSMGSVNDTQKRFTGKVQKIQDPSILSLEQELLGYYVENNSDGSRKMILKFLRNSTKIRKVDVSTLKEVLGGFSGAANKGDPSIEEIKNLINSEIERRGKIAVVAIR